MIPNRGISTQIQFFLILLLAAILRFYGLDRLGLWADEVWVAMDSSSGSLQDMLRAVYYQDIHPPGYYLLSRLNQMIVGNSDFAIRLPSAIAGVLLVAATFITGRKHLSPRAALIAAAIMATSYQGIYYSQEARANIFTALFSLLSFHYFRALALEQDKTWRNFIVFWSCCGLNAYFHYVGVVICIALGLIYLCLLVFRCDRRFCLLGIKMFFPVLLLYIPWIPGLHDDLTSGSLQAWQRKPTLETLDKTIGFLLGPGELFIWFFRFILALLPVWVIWSFLKGGKKVVNNDKWLSLVCVWLLIILPVGIFFIKSLMSQPAYNHRNFIYVIPLACLLSGVALNKGIELLPDKLQNGAFNGLLVCIIIYQSALLHWHALYTADHFKQNYREAAMVVAQDKDFVSSLDSDSMIVVSTRFFNHYLRRFIHRDGDFLLDSAEALEQLESRLQQKSITEFYYLEVAGISAANDMVTVIDGKLAEHFIPQCRSRFPRGQALKFGVSVMKPDMSPDWQALQGCVTER